VRLIRRAEQGALPDNLEIIRRRIVERTGVERPLSGIGPDKTGNQQAIYRKGVAVTRVERREPAFPRALHFSHVDFPFFVGTMNSVAARPRPLALLKAASERKAPARGCQRAQIQLWICSYTK
jgi:hypothetical protein